MFKLSPDVVFRELEGEAVLLDLSSGTYFGLNAAGTRVWQLLEAGHDERRIVDALASEYEAERTVIAGDVARILADLRGRRLIVETSEGP
jgi:Coenzyme PQQ synthesis protein D (PqqD)